MEMGDEMEMMAGERERERVHMEMEMGTFVAHHSLSGVRLLVAPSVSMFQYFHFFKYFFIKTW